VHDDPGLAILNESDFEAIQGIFEENKVLNRRNTKKSYPPIKGLIWCHCGRKAGAYHRGEWSYFRCTEHRQTNTNAQTLWQQAKGLFSSVVANPSTVSTALLQHLKSASNRDELEKRRQGILTELRSLDKSMENVMRMVALVKENSELAEIKALNEVERIEKRRGSLSRELMQVEDSLKASQDTQLDAERLERICRRLVSVLDQADDGEWKNLLREFGFQIILHDDAPHVMKVSLDVELQADVSLQQS